MKIIDPNYKRRYEYKSIRWALCNEDYSDLTLDQIAEVFGLKKSYLINIIRKIQEDTGYEVQFLSERSVNIQRLKSEDFSDLTQDQIAKKLGIHPTYCRLLISKLKKQGHEIKYKDGRKRL